jgi:hypothetical protein
MHKHTGRATACGRTECPHAGPDPERLLTSAAIGLMPLWTRRHLHLPWLPIAEQTVVRGMGAAAVGTIRWAMTPTTD